MSIATAFRPAPRSTSLPALSAPDLIVVGGVPGAGKTTAIAAATTGLIGVAVLDPEHLHRAIRTRIPAWVPYRAYRALIHTAHTVAVLAQLLIGPLPGRRLVVHDPGTRHRRRRLFLGLARRRGWRVALVYVDVDRAAARDGQFERGRALRSGAFERHWDRWQALRGRLDRPVGETAGEPVLLVDRTRAAVVLRWLCLGLDPRRVGAGSELGEPVRAA